MDRGGSVANYPGWLVTNVLHFANGRAWDTRAANNQRVSTPAPAFGLGRLMMRRYEGTGFGAGGAWTTWAVAVFTGTAAVLDLGELPPDIRRIRATAWWLETNVGVGEEKARIAMHLVSAEGGWFLGGSHTTETAVDQVLRIDLDEDDPSLPCPSAGQSYLILQGVEVPPSKRSFEGAFRAVYVAVSWETGSDPTRISCTPGRVRPTPCDAATRVVTPTSRVADGAGDVHVHLLEHLNGQIAGTATGAMPSPLRRLRPT